MCNKFEVYNLTLHKIRIHASDCKEALHKECLLQDNLPPKHFKGWALCLLETGKDKSKFENKVRGDEIEWPKSSSCLCC
jgi:hypothetical protein